MRLFQRHQLETLFLQQVERRGQDGAAESAQMHQQHITDVPAIHQPRLRPAQVQKFRCRAQVARFQPGNRLGVLLVHASRIRAVPQVVLPIKRDLRDPIAMRFQVVAHRPPFLHCVAFMQVRIAEPVPVQASLRQQFERGLVLFNLPFKCFRRILLQVHVRVGVIAHGLGCRPKLQRLSTIRAAFQFPCVHKPVHGRHVLLFQHRQRFPCDLRSRHARRKRSILGQIVHRDSQLLCAACRTKNRKHPRRCHAPHRSSRHSPAFHCPPSLPTHLLQYEYNSH